MRTLFLALTLFSNLSLLANERQCFEVHEASYKPRRNSLNDSYRVILVNKEGDGYRLADARVVRRIFRFLYDEEFSIIRFKKMKQSLYSLNQLEIGPDEAEGVVVCLKSIDILEHEVGSPTLREAEVVFVTKRSTFID